MQSITQLLKQGIVLGDGGYLIELERRGYVDNGTRRERAGPGEDSPFTPEVAIEQPQALRELHHEFLAAGSQVLQALTFFGTRERLNRAGYGSQAEAINTAAVRLARETAGIHALVAGSISRTLVFEREGASALGRARDHLGEQIRFLKDAGVDFLILETFFHLAEMEVALECASTVGLPALATMSFRPLVSHCSDGHTPAECARRMADLGAIAVGANCEQDPVRMRSLLREMRQGLDGRVPLAAQPAAFRTTDTCHSFTRLPSFPAELETIQVPRHDFFEFGRVAAAEGLGFVGGCCGCNAAYLRALAEGLHPPA